MNQLSNIVTLASHPRARTILRHFALLGKAQVRAPVVGLVCHWIVDDATDKLHCKWSADACECSDQSQSLSRLAG